MTSIRHTEFAPFVLDLVDFMEKKIRMGLEDEDARAKAAGDAAGVAPLLRGRLCENETAQAQAMLLLDKQMYDADAAKWWADLAGVDRAAFENQAADLLALLAVFRQVAAGGVGLRCRARRITVSKSVPSKSASGQMEPSFPRYSATRYTS